MEELLQPYSRRSHRKGKSSITERSLFRLYFINPFSAGLFGFAVFLFFEVLFLTAADLLGLISPLKVGLSQITIAGLGFVLQFIFRLIKNFE